ncbi:MAG: DedA family protein [Bacteroidota bacterium]|nr:MAG: DedA family protein [Bacteroidota bacterium]
MHDLFNLVIDWYKENLNYGTITLLMAVESSFVPLPSELVIPPAAYLAHQGKLSMSLIILFSTIGCVIGAMFNYILSITVGRKVIYALANSKWARVFFINQHKLENAEAYFNKNGNTSTFIGRLIPGIRHLISIPAGLSKMNVKNFILYTFAGSAIWNTTLALMSYFLIDKWEVYFREITYGFIILGAGFIAYLIYKAVKRNNKNNGSK